MLIIVNKPAQKDNIMRHWHFQAFFLFSKLLFFFCSLPWNKGIICGAFSPCLKVLKMLPKELQIKRGFAKATVALACSLRNWFYCTSADAYPQNRAHLLRRGGAGHAHKGSKSQAVCHLTSSLKKVPGTAFLNKGRLSFSTDGSVFYFQDFEPRMSRGHSLWHADAGLLTGIRLVICI